MATDEFGQPIGDVNEAGEGSDVAQTLDPGTHPALIATGNQTRPGVGGTGPTGPRLSADEAKSLREKSLGDGLRDASAGGLSLTDEQLLTKQSLDREEKVNVFIPLDPGERQGQAYRSVTINGYRFELKKGMMINVPKSVAMLVMDALNIEASTLNNNENNLNRADADTRSRLDA